MPLRTEGTQWLNIVVEREERRETLILSKEKTTWKKR